MREGEQGRGWPIIVKGTRGGGQGGHAPSIPLSTQKWLKTTSEARMARAITRLYVHTGSFRENYSVQRTLYE